MWRFLLLPLSPLFPRQKYWENSGWWNTGTCSLGKELLCFTLFMTTLKLSSRDTVFSSPPPPQWHWSSQYHYGKSLNKNDFVCFFRINTHLGLFLIEHRCFFAGKSLVCIILILPGWRERSPKLANFSSKFWLAAIFFSFYLPFFFKLWIEYRQMVFKIYNVKGTIFPRIQKKLKYWS